MGVRLMPKSAASLSSSIQWPGSKARAKICWRSRSATCSYSGRDDKGAAGASAR